MPHPTTPERLEDALAAQLSIDRDQFLDVYGAAWEVLEQPLDPGDIDQDDSKPWYVAGRPLQLMLQIDGPRALIARPVGRWQGVYPLVYGPADAKEISGDPATDKQMVAALLKARRATFRFCSLRRSQNAPEWMTGSTCMGCASQWLGVVYTGGCQLMPEHRSTREGHRPGRTPGCSPREQRP
ncbi:hypothetical protein GCM10027456_77510 [Kineosporia babensis]